VNILGCMWYAHGLTEPRRASNLRMSVFFNARDRETCEWPNLFQKADSRFKIVTNKHHAREPGDDVGPTIALIEAIWEG
jgi:hypothetical protein